MTRKITMMFEVSDAPPIDLHEALCLAIHEGRYEALEAFAPQVFDIVEVDRPSRAPLTLSYRGLQELGANHAVIMKQWHADRKAAQKAALKALVAKDPTS